MQPPLICSLVQMSESEQKLQWSHFHPGQIDVRFKAQASRTTPLLLRPFFSAEMARLSAGAASDGFGMKPSNKKFHSAWQADPLVRARARANGLHVVADMVCAPL